MPFETDPRILAERRARRIEEMQRRQTVAAERAAAAAERQADVARWDAERAERERRDERRRVARSANPPRPLTAEEAADEARRGLGWTRLLMAALTVGVLAWLTPLDPWWGAGGMLALATIIRVTERGWRENLASAAGHVTVTLALAAVVALPFALLGWTAVAMDSWGSENAIRNGALTGAALGGGFGVLRAVLHLFRPSPRRPIAEPDDDEEPGSGTRAIWETR